jgi:hypothetical protein
LKKLALKKRLETETLIVQSQAARTRFFFIILR